MLRTILVFTVVYSGLGPVWDYDLVSPDPVPYGFFGWSVSGVPDLNGDGRGDVVVGSIQEDPGLGVPGTGMAYLYDGASSEFIQFLVSPNSEQFAQFGSSVTGLDDVNGDGLGDILVGAPGESSSGGLFQAGRAYVFDGSSGMVLYPLESPEAESEGHFGESTSILPDVNGDGYDDLLIGASRENIGSRPVDGGRAYILDGVSGAVIHTLISPNAFDFGYFGCSVSGVPDVNGDGRGDAVVGAIGEFPPHLPRSVGRAYIFDGSSGLLIHTLNSPNQEAYGQFGNSVSGIFDVNGDGRGDVIVGALNEDLGSAPADAGSAYIFDGSSGALLHTLVSPRIQQSANFGVTVAGIPDANKDGFGDVVVGANRENIRPGPDVTIENAGAAYIFSGSTGQLLDIIESPLPEKNGNFGHSFSSLPGVSEGILWHLVLGAYNEDAGPGKLDSGRAHLFFEREPPTPTPTNSPTDTPTQSPTETPTASDTPTHSPTDSPTDTPTNSPTETPTWTDTPTDSPTDSPTATDAPTESPTETPSNSPTASPTMTDTPTYSPTETPTLTPRPLPTFDVHQDGFIDEADIYVFLRDRLSRPPRLDFNNDTRVDDLDLYLLGKNWHRGERITPTAMARNADEGLGD